MKVKIGDVWYDHQNQAICIELSGTERNYIANMSSECTKFAVFPDCDKSSEEDKLKWMDGNKE